MNEVKTALISVSDKTDIINFAKELQKLGIKILSTGGTFKELKKAGIKVQEVSDFTGFPELMDGRVKTLHPKIHAGILGKRKDKKHLKEAKENKIEFIDLVAVNLYPFKETIEKNSSLEECIENIDIGGSSMIRSAAKNHEFVAVVTSLEQYTEVIEELKKNKNKLSNKTKQKLAAKAFSLTAFYDSLIADYLKNKFNPEELFPEKLSLGFEKISSLRYGENPHQKAAVFKDGFSSKGNLTDIEILNGKTMSFNNYFDADSALSLAKEFSEPCAVILKHTNPCGVAVSEKLEDAFQKALDCDKESAFGGVIALNKKVNLETAKKITSFFNEIVLAPDFEEKAMEELKTKKNLRVIKVNDFDAKPKGFDLKRIKGGLLVQEFDKFAVTEKELNFVSQKKPSKEQIAELLFAFKVVKHIKSNAIVVSQNNATIGLGVGQTSRVKSVKLALEQAQGKMSDAVLASDGFFPFSDSIEVLPKEITAVIEPGGS
ncbi:bifunctional phosphoribosylaminoimidazolecarboxamide formyltransferase/IMP cyclohydrolase, partial [Candidatus Micrarchaeota archaeon]|nr:bifunctional phosphoribosylaminoimidazolecarboxamide formyltransferase/IMP cyclohydrolase [Candidatus Micrarchaeota archaeon]